MVHREKRLRIQHTIFHVRKAQSIALSTTMTLLTCMCVHACQLAALRLAQAGASVRAGG